MMIYQKSGSIFTYVSMKSEADTKEMILQALKDGKKVYSPRVGKRTMDFYEIDSINSLIQSNFGVLEPAKEERKRFNPDHQPISEKEIKLMLLPGLAFDYNGSRIGYGAGYYDRYLAKHFKVGFIKIALAFDFQVLDQITSDDYDIKADMIITPTKLIRCRLNGN